MKTKKLIYAIINSKDAPAVAATGILNAPLEVVYAKDLAAVVSDVNPELLETADKELLVQLGVAFGEVNIRLHEATTIVPLSFGTCADDDDAVVAVLHNCYLLFHTLLASVCGYTELVVKASWDVRKVLESIKNSDKHFQDLQHQCNGSAPDNGTLMRLGEYLYDKVQEEREGLANIIHAALSPLARESSPGLCLSDDAVASYSYLVAREDEKAFDEAVNNLDAQLSSQLTFKYIGPLPPASFVNVDLSQTNLALVERSRQQLELGETASRAELQNNFRRLLKHAHPDMDTNDPSLTRTCRDLISSYKALVVYCENYSEYHKSIDCDQFLFTPEAVEQVIQVRQRQLI